MKKVPSVLEGESGSGLVEYAVVFLLLMTLILGMVDFSRAIYAYHFISNQARTYVGGLTPDKTGEQRDSLVIKFSAIKKDYGPAGIRVEVGDVGILPAWTENNSLQVRAGHAKALFIGPVFMDREIPRLQARYDELDRIGPQLSSEQKQEMIQVSSRLQMLKHRRELLLARTGDEYVVAPPNLP